MDFSHRFKTLETNLIHAGSPRPRIGGAVVTPLFQSANYEMAGETAYDALRYIRLSNSPSHLALHAKLAAIASGEAALVTSSGMAAITTTLLAFCKQGDHVLCQRTLYGGTQSFLDVNGPDLGLSYTSIETQSEDAPARWREALQPNTKLIYVEGISNPLMEVGDLRAVVRFARDNGLVSVIDNTFPSPVNFRPLELGFDLSVHSATKYLNGHSDIVAGAVMGSAENVDRVRQRLVHFGGSADPHACFLFERGLKTLALRMERHGRNGQGLAEYLESRPEIRWIHYPGLRSDPGHRFASDLFDGYSGMLSFYTDTVERADRLIERLQIATHAPSLGGPETLVVRPARSSHLGLSEADRERLGITDDLVRISVGLENLEELIADFAQALE